MLYFDLVIVSDRLADRSENNGPNVYNLYIEVFDLLIHYRYYRPAVKTVKTDLSDLDPPRRMALYILRNATIRLPCKDSTFSMKPLASIYS